jgi:hypothetical protein
VFDITIKDRFHLEIAKFYHLNSCQHG